MSKEDFGTRLQQALELNDMKAIELSERTGISRGALSSYISGRWKAKQGNLYLLAKALNVSPAWLMGYDVPMTWQQPNPPTQDISIDIPTESQGYYNDPEVAELAEELRTNPDYRILFDASKNLTKEDIDTVLKIIEGLKAREGK